MRTTSTGRKDGSLGKDTDIRLLAAGLVAFYDGLMVYLAIGIEMTEVKKMFAEIMKAIL